MKLQTLKKFFNPLIIPLALALFALGWWFGLPAEEKQTSTASSASDTTWTCSMHPQIRQPKPGLCPICNMDLIPLEGGESGGIRQISISAEASTLLDIRVSPVTALAENATRKISAFGKITHDERLTSSITAHIDGRIDQLFIDYIGSHVHKDEPLAELYSPEIYLAQKELIEARNSSNSSVKNALYNAALHKLELLEIAPQDIATILTAEKPSDRITIRSPRSGIVWMKNVVTGTYVKTGDPLFTVVDHSTVWLSLDVYEADLTAMEEGLTVTFTIDAVPGETFTGKIDYIDHRIDPVQRVGHVRIDVPNPDNLIKPGMFASAKIHAKAPTGENLVTVPESAVLRTGDRAVVYVRSSDTEPIFDGREVLLGALIGDRYIIRQGLAEGENVVTRGAFKLDSELQLKAKPSMMNPTAGFEEKPAHSAPEDLAGQWQPVLRALARMNSENFSKEIETMETAIKAVSQTTFQPETLNLWSEFSNRLLIDLKRAKSEPPAIAISIVTKSIEQAARYLGLPFTAEKPNTTDPETIARLKKAVDLYLPIAKALALDNPEQAANAAAILAESTETDSIREPANAIAATQDLKAQRVPFKTLSTTLIAEIRANGLDRIGTAYVVHCPMVGSNTGADWISSVPEVLNPYFGDSMLNCGSVTQTLSLTTENTNGTK